MTAYGAGQRLFADRAEEVSHLLVPGAPLAGFLFVEEMAARDQLGEDQWWWWFTRGWWAREEAEA